MKRDISVPAYIYEMRHGAKKVGFNRHNAILYAITAFAILLMCVSVMAIEVGDITWIWPDITMILSIEWIVLFIYVNDQPRKGRKNGIGEEH